MSLRNLCALVVVAFLATLSPALAQIPDTVSPGTPSGWAVTEARCPTFSWGVVGKANFHELVVYRIDGDIEETQPTLRERLAGTVGSWTPSVDHCLEPGGKYAWSVRAAGDHELGEWSPPRLFQVASWPSQEELAEAVALVREDLNRDRAGPLRTPRPVLAAPALVTGEIPSPPSIRHRESSPAAVPNKVGLEVYLDETTGVQTWGVSASSQSSEDGSVGIWGSSTAASGDVQGVVGSTSSPDGIGVFGLSNHETSGVGVLGEAEGCCVGVAGFAESADGVGGFFWNYLEPGVHKAIGVADTATYPTLDFKFFVDTAGNVGLDGMIEMRTETDSPPTCNATTNKGSIYFDTSENWLCLCDGTGWKRIDDPLDGCS